MLEAGELKGEKEEKTSVTRPLVLCHSTRIQNAFMPSREEAFSLLGKRRDIALLFERRRKEHAS
jgi:hypothetical protein